MSSDAYALASGPLFHHPGVFYWVIAIFGVAVVTVLVVGLFLIVLKMINREWPIR